VCNLLARLLRPVIDRIAEDVVDDLGLVGRDEMLRALKMLEDRMTNAETQANDRFAALLGTVIAEIKSLRAGQETFAVQLAQAVADGDKATADALAADALADAARLDGYSDLLSELYPADVPVVDVPAPGQPADPPVVDGDPIEVPTPDVPAVDVPVTEPTTGETPDAGDETGTSTDTDTTAP
jgi:hypothetical protein